MVHGDPQPTYTIPKSVAPYPPCRATLRHEATPCPNVGHVLHNGLCEACEHSVVDAMHAQLCHLGKFALAHELAACYKARKWNPYTLRSQ